MSPSLWHNGVGGGAAILASSELPGRAGVGCPPRALLCPPPGALPAQPVGGAVLPTPGFAVLTLQLCRLVVGGGAVATTCGPNSPPPSPGVLMTCCWLSRSFHRDCTSNASTRWEIWGGEPASPPPQAVLRTQEGPSWLTSLDVSAPSCSGGRLSNQLLRCPHPLPLPPRMTQDPVILVWSSDHVAWWCGGGQSHLPGVGQSGTPRCAAQAGQRWNGLLCCNAHAPSRQI